MSVFQNDGSRATVSSEAVGPVRPRGGRALRAAEEAGARPGRWPCCGNDDPRSVYQEALRDAGFEAS
ncbi:MAG: hypothetical protein ACLSDQ_01275 [Adlercreutzia equolifaciens]